MWKEPCNNDTWLMCEKRPLTQLLHVIRLFPVMQSLSTNEDTLNVSLNISARS